MCPTYMLLNGDEKQTNKPLPSHVRGRGSTKEDCFYMWKKRNLWNTTAIFVFVLDNERNTSYVLVNLSHLFPAERSVKIIAPNQGLKTDCNLTDYPSAFRHV